MKPSGWRTCKGTLVRGYFSLKIDMVHMSYIDENLFNIPFAHNLSD